MNSGLRRSSRVFALAFSTVLIVALAPASASASPETLKRSVSNIAMAPLDLVFSPLVAWGAVNRNIRDIDDTTGVRVAYFVPGFFWVMGLQMGASAIRAVTGALEFLPGLVLLPFEQDLDTLYDPVERGEALVDIETPLINLKFGIDYQSPAY